jgi:DNA polymerase III subunit beta
MDININRENLLPALQAVMGVVEAKQTMRILSHVKVLFEQDRLQITGTDLEVELIGNHTLPTSIEGTYVITVPGKKLLDICKALPENAMIELRKNKGQISLHCNHSKFTLSTLPAEDFPDTQNIQETVSFEITQGQLKTLLQRTSFAMAQHDVRYYLNGMLLEICPSEIRAVATDGHRLALNRVDIKSDADHKVQCIIPRKAALELNRLLDTSDNIVEVSVGNNFIRVKTPQCNFTSKLVEGRFPDYERVIPKNTTNMIYLDKEEFKNSLSRSAILCNEKFRGVRVLIKDNMLKITADNPEQEVAEEKLQVKYDGQEMDIGFNVSYLLENLNTLKTDQVALKFTNANSSILLEEVEGNHDSIFVIMPMRL